MAENATTDSGRIVKMEVDYSSTCDEKIPECQKLAKEGKVHDALDTLLALEKQTRTVSDVYFDFYLEENVRTELYMLSINSISQVADTSSTGRVLVAIVQICFEAKNWNALNEHIALLAKRRSQLKQAVAKMVQECCAYVDQTPNKETKLKLIDTLRNVTEGKVSVF